MAPLLAGYVCMRCSLPLATLVRRDPAVVSEPVAVLLVKESAEASEQFLDSGWSGAREGDAAWPLRLRVVQAAPSPGRCCFWCSVLFNVLF